jgi:hypothetical protein
MHCFIGFTGDCGCGGTPPPYRPLVPGPLDIEFLDPITSTFSREFDLASPDAVFAVIAQFTGVPSISATHGGEPLALVDYATSGNVIVAAFAGTGLTLERANMVVTVSGGELSRGAMRVNEMSNLQPEFAGWIAKTVGTGTQTGRLTTTGTQGGQLRYLYGHNGVWSAPTFADVAGAERQFYGQCVRGTTVIDGPLADQGWRWNAGGWWINDEGNFEIRVLGNPNGGYYGMVQDLDPTSDGLYIEADVVIDEGGAMMFQTTANNSSYPSINFYGPYTGVIKGALQGTGLIKALVYGRGHVVIKSLLVKTDTDVFNYCFGYRPDPATDGVGVVGRYGDGAFAMMGIEALGEPYAD